MPGSSRPRPRWPWWLALAAWLAVAACLSLPGSRRTEPSFPHRVHVIDNELTCTFCHPGAVGGERPGMPPPELCAACHDRFDADKPPERRVAAFYDERSRYRTLADSSVPADVQFSHRRHTLDAKLDCTACHGDVARREEVPLAPLVQKAACMDCHARHGKANACGECHAEIDERWQPASHHRNWIRGHGDLVRAGSERSADRCDLCHQDAQGCLGCHQQMPPDGHNNNFRLRTHGLQASMDRSRCFVCHTQDSCQQCHQQAAPRSHRGGFGSPQNRHCTGCHLPLADTGCATCHRAAPAHETARPLPPDHVPSMNCRLCHGNGQPLPHPDGGHVCTACHR
ncbi:MAG: hypothetical protein KF830_13685 [Planctomycetes bacterium]|nr:hypothetical protein [Planctomycetota bacterium]